MAEGLFFRKVVKPFMASVKAALSSRVTFSIPEISSSEEESEELSFLPKIDSSRWFAP